jgi:hypothetical protein
MHQPKARGETGRRVRFYVALGLVTAATLMLQIIETRIISVISWYHLAFFVISVAMFGLTAICVAVLAAALVRPRWSRASRSRRPLCPCPGTGRLPDGLWISDRHAIGLHDQYGPHAVVLGHQRRCRRSRRECCLGHQYCLQHRYDAKDRSCLLSLGRGSRRIVGVRRRAIQPHRPTIPAPTKARTRRIL